MIVVEDESIFTYDVKIRKIWAIKGSKPIVFTTGSKRKTVVFGALSKDGKQLFKQYDKANSDGFLDFIKILHKKFPKMILFLDKASYHKTEARVKCFLRKHRKSIKVRWFPSGFPEANPVEECWNQGKEDVLGSTFYDSYVEFKREITKYYRTKRFNLDLYNYLCR